MIFPQILSLKVQQLNSNQRLQLSLKKYYVNIRKPIWWEVQYLFFSSSLHTFVAGELWALENFSFIGPLLLFHWKKRS